MVQQPAGQGLVWLSVAGKETNLRWVSSASGSKQIVSFPGRCAHDRRLQGGDRGGRRLGRAFIRSTPNLHQQVRKGGFSDASVAHECRTSVKMREYRKKLVGETSRSVAVSIISHTSFCLL